MSTTTYNKRDVQRILKNNGWKFERKTGSHCIYGNANGQHITVTVDRPNKMVFQRLIKEYNLKVD